MAQRNNKYRFLPTEYASFRQYIRVFFEESILPNSKTILDPWAGTAPLAASIELKGKEG